MSDVMNRPWSFSENSVASYSMLIGGTWTASIHDKRTHSSMYSVNFTQFCNSGKSYKVLHSCLLTSFKAKKEKKCWKSPYEVIRHLFTHGRNDGVKGMSRGLSERKQLIEPACPAVETVYSVHIVHMGLKECHVVSRKENSWLNAARVLLAKLFIPST